MRDHEISRLLISFALTLSAVAANATPTTYFGEDLSPGGTLPPGGNADTAHYAFLASINGAGTDDIEGIAAGTISSFGLTFVGSTGPITGNLTGIGASVNDEVRGSPFDGRFAISGDNYWQTADTFTIDFSQPVSAFGFFGTDTGDGPGQLSLSLSISGGGSTNVLVPHSIGDPLANGAVFFYGFTDMVESYSSISFSTTDPGHDFSGFDDFTVGTPNVDDDSDSVDVPEPTTLALLSFGLAGMGFSRRRKGA